MFLLSWNQCERQPVPARPTKRHRTRRRPMRRLRVEPLEERRLLASDLSGAALVADILPGEDSFAPRNFANMDGTLFFTDWGGEELWKSNGTESGTLFLKDGFPGGNCLSGGRFEFASMGGTVFFTPAGCFKDRGLWKSDGTSSGTVLVKSLGSAGSLQPASGKLFFAGNAGALTGTELWVSDGTTGGTVLVKDINPGTTRRHTCWRDRSGERQCGFQETPNSSAPRGLTDFNGTLLFAANDGKGVGLWRSDGSTDGTTLIKKIGALQSEPVLAGGLAWFAAGGKIWTSDGTSSGTQVVARVQATDLTEVGGTIFFVGTDKKSGAELWKTDGTKGGTKLVKDIHPGNANGNVQWLTSAGGTLYFAADDGIHGRELWKSDGTQAGTVLVKDIKLGAADGAVTLNSSLHPSLANVNGLLYFAADDGTSGPELWQSDGTGAGTEIVRDIFPGSSGSYPDELTVMNNKLYFAATDPDHGRELWDPPPVEPAPANSLIADHGGEAFRPLFTGSVLIVAVDPLEGSASDAGESGGTLLEAPALAPGRLPTAPTRQEADPTAVAPPSSSASAGLASVELVEQALADFDPIPLGETLLTNLALALSAPHLGET